MSEPDKPVPEPTPSSSPYWAAAAQGHLSVPWCRSCAAWVFPPRPRCPGCGGTDIEWRTPATTGSVVTYTVVHQAAYQAYRADAPYVVAVVLLDGGPQLLANLLGVDPDAELMGRRVEVSFETRGEGVGIPQFRPLDDG